MYQALAPGAIGVKASFEQAVEMAAKHGFKGISVDMGPVESLGLETVREMLAAHHLLPALTGMPVNFRQDEAKFEEGMAGLPHFAETMAALGCTRAATWLMPWHETLSYQENFEQLRRRTKRICQVLQSYGLRYGLEYVGPATMRKGRPNPFIHNLDQLLDLIAAVDEGNLGVLLDSYHWYAAGEDASDLAKLSDRLVVVVHVNDAPVGVPREEQMDNVRGMPGETGVIDIRTFLGALEQMGYTGPVMAEPFSERVRQLPPDEAVAATAESMNKIWQIAGLQ